MSDTTDFSSQRLELLMEAIDNDKLEGEVCLNCFQKNSTPALRQAGNPIRIQTELVDIGKGKIVEILTRLKELRGGSLLKRVNGDSEIIKEYLCPTCQRSYIGELNLIASESETRVLSFFGYDDSKSYKKDFYSLSLIDDTYDSFVEELWKDNVKSTIKLLDIEDSEDIITGKVLGQMTVFFQKFADVVYKDMGAKVKAFSKAHAGKIESGHSKYKEIPASGADFAIWIGPLTREQVALLEAYEKGLIKYDQLPVLVGNGAIFQAKKENGNVDKKQINDLVRYASISHKGHDYLGIPGKLFMNYSAKPPHVTVLSCDFTHKLYQYCEEFLPSEQKSVTFKKALDALRPYATEVSLPEFIHSYLSGKTGTPLLMLQDVLATPGPKLVVGLPLEAFRTLSKPGQCLSGIVASWTAALGERLERIEEVEYQAAQQQEEAQWHKMEQLRREAQEQARQAERLRQEENEREAMRQREAQARQRAETEHQRTIERLKQQQREQVRYLKRG